MKFCTKCGTPFHEGDQFCAECGAPRGAIRERGDPASRPVQATQNLTQPLPASPTAYPAPPSTGSAPKPPQSQATYATAHSSAAASTASSIALVFAGLAIAAILPTLGIFIYNAANGWTSWPDTWIAAGDWVPFVAYEWVIVATLATVLILVRILTSRNSWAIVVAIALLGWEAVTRIGPLVEDAVRFRAWPWEIWPFSNWQWWVTFGGLALAAIFLVIHLARGEIEG